MYDTKERIAPADRAHVAVLDFRWLSRNACAFAVAEFFAVARIAVSARRASSNGLMHNTKDRIAPADRAQVAVVDFRRNSGDTHARAIAGFLAVARVAVGARFASGLRHRRASRDRIASGGETWIVG